MRLHRPCRPPGVPSFPFAVAGLRLLVAAAGLGVVAYPVQAAVPPPGDSGAAGAEAIRDLESKVHTFTLDNGLRFFVVERHFAPVFSFVTYVDAGGVDEPAGKTGVAHMMEHMAFKGTPRIGTTDAAAEAEALRRVDAAWEVVQEERLRLQTNEADSTRLVAALEAFREAQGSAAQYVVGNAFSKLLEEHGVQGLNAFTSTDQTAYFYSLPSNKLELWALMEASRMTWPVFREFYKEREVVIEERRMGTESSPRGRLRTETWHAAFTAHPYRNGVIGFRSDLEKFGRGDAEAFFRSHYNASNMIVAVVGDVTVEEVRRLAEEYFTAVPSGPRNAPVPTVEPPPNATRVVRTFEEAEPLVFAAYYGAPAVDAPNYAAVDALLDIAASGRASRLYRSLVKDRRIAASVFGYAGFPGSKYPNDCFFTVIPAPGIEPDSAAAALHEELLRFRSDPVTPSELQRYRNRARSEFLQAIDGNWGLAYRLAYYEALTGDWRNLFRWLDRVDALRPEEVTSEAERMFRLRYRTLGIMDRPQEEES